MVPSLQRFWMSLCCSFAPLKSNPGKYHKPLPFIQYTVCFGKMSHHLKNLILAVLWRWALDHAPPLLDLRLKWARVCQWVIIWKFYLCVVEFGSLDQAPLLLDLRFKWAGVESSSIELESSRAQLSWSRVELHRSRASSSTVQIQCICGGSARGEFQCYGVWSCNEKFLHVFVLELKCSWILYVILLFWRS